MDECFYSLDHLPGISQETVDNCINGDFNGQTEEFHCRCTTLPKYFPTLKSNTFLNDLSARFGLVMPMVIRLSPYQIYDWHIDSDVPVKINYVLNDVGENKALTLFKLQTQGNVLYDILECKYTLRKPMLFNSRIEHCAINNSDQTRYLMCIRFLKQTIQYQDVKNFLINYQSTEEL